MPVDGRRPYSEMFEVMQNELIREAASGEEGKYKGVLNQVYLNDLPENLPERYIRKDAFVTTAADYTAGTVTVGTGTARITGVSTSWASNNSDDFMIKVSNADQVFRVTFEAGTSLLFQNSLSWTGNSGTGLTYVLYQDRYQLASDFSYMAKDNPLDPNIVFNYSNGVKSFLDPKTNDELDRLTTITVGSVHMYTVKFTNGTPYLHLQANPDIVENIGYSYIPILNQLREHITGTVTLTTGTSVVLTSNASITTSLDTTRDLYIRNDADGTGSNSLWFKIASVSNDSVATLSSNFTGTSGTGISYTISEVSIWPSRYDDIIMYKACWIVDPDKVQSEKWLALTGDALGASNKTESTRKTNSRFKNFPGLR